MKPCPTLLKLWTIGIPLTIIAYFFIDRPIADFIYAHQIPQHLILLKNIVEWPPIVTGLSPFILLAMLLLNCRNPNPPRWQNMLILLSISVLFAFVLKNELKWIFSRYWPQTWINNNPSWISNHAYGFQWFQGKPFQGTDITGSFPSGHSTIAFASLTSIGLVYRRLFWLCMGLAALEALSMVAFNYHFVSDIIAGACLGITCTMLCYNLFEKKIGL